MFLLHSPSHLLESFLHYVNKLPFGGENLTHQFTHHTTSQLDHNFYTTSSHQYTTHQSSSQLSSTHQSSTSHLSSQLSYFTTYQLLLSTQLITSTTQYSQMNIYIYIYIYIYTMHNYSSTLLEIGCRESVLLLHFG